MIVRAWTTVSVLSTLLCAAACDSAERSPDTQSLDAGPARRASWSVEMSGLAAALLSVWGTSSRDVWTVGGDPGDGLGPYVLHYDGSVWTRLESGAQGDLWWVHGFTDGPVFMAGTGGMILRFEDGRFERMSTPDDTGTVFGIWGTAPDDLWAVGSRSDEGGFVWRFTGSDWETADVSPELIAEQAVFKVWGLSTTQVRLVGAEGLSLEYDGKRFSRRETGTSELLFTVHSDGESFVAVGGRSKGVILEEQARTWVDVAPDGAPALNGVAERDGNAYAVGANGEVLARRGGSWERLETSVDLARDLHSVWIDEDGGVWAVGGHVVGAPLVEGVLIHGPGDVATSKLGTDSPHGLECTRDGQCDDEVFCNGEEHCESGQCALGKPPDCDDGVECTADACDEHLWACRHDATDQDGDGHADPACRLADGHRGGDDCDDTDPGRHPGAQERCDPQAQDEDCDFASVGVLDQDGDGVVSAACCNADNHRKQCGADCDDADPQTHPGAGEVCDERDNDCDGRSDEGALQRFYPDADGDGYGVATGVVEACNRPPGYAPESGDCDDAERGMHPGAFDVCDPDDIDEDCDGTPNDPPGGCRCEPGSTQPCPLPGACAAGRQPCADGIWSVTCTIVPSLEACNEVDDDCDGSTDEDVAGDCYLDQDGDGYPASGTDAERKCLELASSATAGCPTGWTGRVPEALDVDCAPNDDTRSPAASERCDGVDDDCDGKVDEGLALVARYIDADGDGYPGTLAQRCSGDTDSAADATDCMDDQALVHPDQDGSFSSPACPGGSQPCDDHGTWRCRATADEPCAATLALARWDYDCNDEAEQTPPAAAPCNQGNCSGSCGQSGFQPVADPQCGKPQPYQVCRCLGAQGGGCNEMIQMLPMTCK